MTVGQTHVSRTSRNELKKKFQDKVNALREIVGARTWSEGPSRASFLSFCGWESGGNPLVKRISHSAVYKKSDEYGRLRGEAEGLLEMLRKGRAGGRPSGRKTVASLTSELAKAKQESQSFLDQLTMLRAELEVERAEVKALRGDPGVLKAAGGKVVPIRRVRKSRVRKGPK